MSATQSITHPELKNELRQLTNSGTPTTGDSLTITLKDACKTDTPGSRIWKRNSDGVVMEEHKEELQGEFIHGMWFRHVSSHITLESGGVEFEINADDIKSISISEPSEKTDS